jgi:site-specific DNA-cytosine methylase
VSVSVVKNFFCMFSAIGAGAEGMAESRVSIPGMDGRWQCIGGMDIDAHANAVFRRKLGVPAMTADLMDREQFIAFHDHEPPPGWREITPADVRAAAHHQHPHAVFLSAPCKGFSGLLSETKSRTDKYQALNRLTLRGVWLMLEAWADDPVEMILFENVPRLATRGRTLLDRITAMLRAYGYVTAETTHDCGELGGLAQSRKRFLLVARHLSKVPNMLYQPARQPLRAVGDVLGKMPLAGDLRAGVMHRLPSLQWKTWVRLAFVRAGSDWRSLNDLAVEGGQLRDYLLVPAMHRGGYGVRRWDEPTGVVASESRPSNGAFSVADPRVEQSSGWNAGQHYGVHRMDDTAGAITAQAWPNQGRFAVADTRLEDNEFHGFRVVRWDRKAGTVTGARAPGSSAQAVADPRHAGAPKFSNELAVGAWGDGARAVTSAHGTGQCIADPRGGEDAAALHGKYPVTPWGDPARTVIAGNANGAFAVADPRGTPAGRPFGKYHCAEWDEATKTVIASDDHGAYAVADPRTGLDAARGAYLTGGHYGVVPWDATSGAVSAAACHDSGRWSLADPRTCEMEQFVKFEMPAADQKLVAHIVSEDGTWHRPFTTLELAALQSLFDPEDPLQVAAFTDAFTADVGSDSTHREWIGNAVPRAAARAIGAEILRTLLLADAGETFALSATPIWVQPVAVAISLAQGVPA